MPLEDVSGALATPHGQLAAAAALERWRRSGYGCASVPPRGLSPSPAAAPSAPSPVDVAGKYRYTARDPGGGEPLPLLLDVLLVGRTKILKLHGPLWASNSTRHKLGITLAMPAAANGGWGGARRASPPPALRAALPTCCRQGRGRCPQFVGFEAMPAVCAPPRRRASGAGPRRQPGQPPEPAAAAAAARRGALPAGCGDAGRLAVPGAVRVSAAPTLPAIAAESCGCLQLAAMLCANLRLRACSRPCIIPPFFLSFLPTKHDVVRLSCSVLSMKQQQGYVACQPRADVSAQGLRGGAPWVFWPTS